MTKQMHEGQVCPTKFSLEPGEGIALGIAIVEDMLQAYRNFEQKHPHMERVGLLPFDARQLQLMQVSLETLGNYVEARDG
ncbi:hypothetical protein [Dyella acidiphila]|uniref:Uncharacterized protein n=1 Tax=Dyella acidiphila TaxID=2775866 RepID=A0ABR9G689_9GAMM|nr:hypothetical protein [Dyella acidiphila]MBE1159562.1 hypothetical protein [Dyella acidiphila]